MIAEAHVSIPAPIDESTPRIETVCALCRDRILARELWRINGDGHPTIHTLLPPDPVICERQQMPTRVRWRGVCANCGEVYIANGKTRKKE